MASSTSRHLLLLHRYQQQGLRRPAADPQRWSLRTVLQLLSSDQLTCEDLARYCHATAVAGEDVWKLRAFSRLSAWQDIQEAAQAADERRRQGTPKSLLDGIPISIKANLAVEREALTAGSRILGEGYNNNNNNNNDRMIGAVGYNAEIVQQLVTDCGAVCIGITNMDEFGMGSLGTNTIAGHGGTKNPLAFLGADEGIASSPLLLDILQQSTEEITAAHEEQQMVIRSTQNSTTDPYYYAAGGSSCGAAASVAHGSSLVALASDTGGSIRLPAAWCGVVGLKPSYGKISRHGLVSYASSLDTVGFMTPTTECASVVLKELTSKAQLRSPKDSTQHLHLTREQKNAAQQKNTSPAPNKNTERPLEGIKIGIPAAFVVEECPTEVKELWTQGAATLEQAGATIVTLAADIISPGVIQQSLAAYYVLASAEASSNLARYDGFRYGVAASVSNIEDGGDGTTLQRQYAKTRSEGFGTEVIRRILCGTAVLSSDKFHTHYEGAAKLRALVTHQLRNALQEHVNYILIPTVLSPPPRLDAKEEGSDDSNDTTIDNTEMFGNDIMTVPISLAGLAAVNVPFHPASTDTGSSIKAITGLQLVGYRLEEENLLSVAQYMEHDY